MTIAGNPNMPTLCLKRIACEAGQFLLLSLTMGSAFAVEHTFGDGALRIVEPADGATVAPGQDVNFKVEVAPDVLPGFVLIMSDRKSFYVPFAGRLNGPPFE